MASADGPIEKEEVLLPKATISKLIKDTLAGRDMRMAGDTTEMIVDCCTEFIQLVSSEANEVSTREKKQTIGPEHVLKALKELDFTEFIEEVQSAWDQFKEESKVGHANRAQLRRTGADKEGLTAEQQIELQQKMFAAARAQTGTSAENAAEMAREYQAAQLAAIKKEAAEQAAAAQQAQQEAARQREAAQQAAAAAAVPQPPSAAVHGEAAAMDCDTAGGATQQTQIEATASRCVTTAVPLPPAAASQAQPQPGQGGS